MAAAELDTLISSEIPDGRQNLLDSHTNLERVADYCENNYYQSPNKRAALEETKGYTTQSLASVAYQINTLAFNFLQMLDLQANQLSEMESQVNHISQTVNIHKEKVARREIGVLTTNKSIVRQYKIIAPASPERPVKYVRKPIDYSILDDIGHGVRVSQAQQVQVPQQHSSTGQYGPGMMAASHYAPGVKGTYGSVSSPSPGPAPTTKPPTPPQTARYSSGGTLNRSKDYRTPSVVIPPQVPSNYAPNYPKSKQYGTLPHAHAQVQMVQPVQHIYGEHTMPRLSSSSLRSTSSQRTSGYNSGSTPPRPVNEAQFNRQSSSSTSQYSTASIGRPTQRPPSPPLPLPPPSAYGTPPKQQMVYAQWAQDSSSSGSTNSPGKLAETIMYSRQVSGTYEAASEVYARQHLQTQLSRQNSQPTGLARQTSHASTIGGASDLSGVSSVPSWIPKNYIERVTAIYDYTADKEDELSFSEGSIIYVLKKNDDGWWEGVMNGITGLFPGNYVEATL